jgi:hypothetical protein
MSFPRRVRWLEGRHANVDGIPFRMPVRTETSPVLFAVFPIDAAKARTIVDCDELHPWQVRGRGLLVVAVVNYSDTTIGRYIEFCLGVLVTRGRRRAGAALPLLLRSRHGTGVYIQDLPVSTEISVKGGLGIWGMPKRQAQLDFVVSDDTVSSQYDLDDQLVARVDIPRPRRAWLPVRATGVGWGAGFRGQFTKSRFSARGKAGFNLRPRRARLLLGDHPVAKTLADLDIGDRALLSGFMPKMNGILDDHVESWYLTASQPPKPADADLASVADLTLSEEWLRPPDRDRVDRMDPARSHRRNERVGVQPGGAAP